MNEEEYKKVLTIVILLALLFLAYLLIKPILIPAILGVILAFVFTPLYNWLYIKTQSENASAFLLCILLILLLVIPFWFLTPILIDQSIKVYMASQQADFITPLKIIFPSIFSSAQFSTEIGSILHSFVTKITNSAVNLLSQLILNSPTLFLQASVILFVFYFVLRDQEELISYIQSLLPFSKEIERKLFKKTNDITFSVLYGQIVVGTIQGIVTGIGFFIFGIPNALLLTLLSIAVGILPIIGTSIIWIPLALFLVVDGNIFSAMGISIFGLLSSGIDNILKPIFISKRTQVHSSVILIGMVGGIFLFGVMGFVLGPLILAYLLVILEIYRNKRNNGVFSIEEVS